MKIAAVFILYLMIVGCNGGSFSADEGKKNPDVIESSEVDEIAKPDLGPTGTIENPETDGKVEIPEISPLEGQVTPGSLENSDPLPSKNPALPIGSKPVSTPSTLSPLKPTPGSTSPSPTAPPVGALPNPITVPSIPSGGNPIIPGAVPRPDTKPAPNILPVTKPNNGSTHPGPILLPPLTPTPPVLIPTQVFPPAPIPDLEPVFTECVDYPFREIVASLYEIPAQSTKLPDFSSISPIKTVCMENLNIPDRDFLEGFPGVEGMVEWFALDIHFRLETPIDGVYGFKLNSDDGSILIINGQTIIVNDGLHEQNEVINPNVMLKKGMNDIQVKYFQGPRVRIALELKWKTPHMNSYDYLPLNYLHRPL
ncbi:MAG: hypothetical protein EOP04_02055 [Proteobacteria bacterium]|nr:MAG: hypothetical protein EOP04_02055 [Pseudomonadota bacterium]